MKTTRLFTVVGDQAVCIPDEFAFPDGTELTILRSGDVITMYPKKASIFPEPGPEKSTIDRVEG